ncbi:MAG: hypothetical protein PHF18_13950 [Methanosarcina sp.]|nr:hypothetical protein [Methanosarcina sp.]
MTWCTPAMEYVRAPAPKNNAKTPLKFPNSIEVDTTFQQNH